MSQYLDQLLEELREQGTFESHDEFGVDLVRSQSKQALFQLADSGFYLLKILQAAVCCGAAQVRVNLTQDEVCVVCPCPVQPSDLTALGDSRHLNEHLLTGMRAAQAQQPQELVWKAWTGTQGAGLFLPGEAELKLEVGGTPPPGLDPEFSGHGFYLRRKARDWLHILSAHTPQLMAEHRAVNRAANYPVPLVLDGRLLNGVEEPALTAPMVSVALQRVHPKSMLAERYLLSPDPTQSLPVRPSPSLLVEANRLEVASANDLLYFRRPRTFYSQFMRLDSQQPWFPSDDRQLWLDTRTVGPRELPGAAEVFLERGTAGKREVTVLSPIDRHPHMPGRLSCRVRLSIPLSLEGPGSIQVVKDGVDLASFEADLGCPGARAQVSLRVATDLSQFGVVQNPALESLRLYLRAHVRSMCHDLKPYLPRLQRLSPELARHVQARLR